LSKCVKMSYITVLQSCPSQLNALLSALGSPLLSDDLVVKFYVSNLKPHFPYQVAFQVDVVHTTKTIGRTMIDEGTSTCVMAFSCWQSLGSLELAPSPTLFPAFDGQSFKPHRIIPSFDISLGGKIVQVEVEVVDAPIDYNLLLGRIWMYAMRVIVSSMFRVIQFPHEGKIVTIDQLSFTWKNPNSPAGSKISLIDNSTPMTESVGIGLYPSLMGTFAFSFPILFMSSSSNVPEKESAVSVI